MNNTFAEKAAGIIKKILYVNIASVTPDGRPWNSPVYSAFDAEFNFYWASDKESQHSINLSNNSEAFLVIYDSTVPEGTGEGVYIQTVVSELSTEEKTMDAVRVLDMRIGKTKERSFAKYSNEAPIRIYLATPTKIWMNSDEVDENGQYVKDIRVEIPVAELKKYL